MTLGFGLGALLDGIVLHQVLQWHHLVSSRRDASTPEGLRVNLLADGIFHLASWAVVLAGVVLVVREATRNRSWTWRRFAGLLLIGWGVFNVVDHFVFHLALDAHHIRPGAGEALYDWGFMLAGLALAAVGTRMSRSGRGRSWRAY